MRKNPLLASDSEEVVRYATEDEVGVFNLIPVGVIFDKLARDIIGKENTNEKEEKDWKIWERVEYQVWGRLNCMPDPYGPNVEKGPEGAKSFFTPKGEATFIPSVNAFKRAYKHLGDTREVLRKVYRRDQMEILYEDKYQVLGILKEEDK